MRNLGGRGVHLVQHRLHGRPCLLLVCEIPHEPRNFPSQLDFGPLAMAPRGLLGTPLRLRVRSLEQPYLLSSALEVRTQATRHGLHCVKRCRRVIPCPLLSVRLSHSRGGHEPLVLQKLRARPKLPTPPHPPSLVA